VNGARIQQQLAAVALCCLVSSSALAQTAPAQQQQAPAQTTPAPEPATTPDAPSATQQSQPVSIVQADQQAQRSIGTPPPFQVELPHSHNPFAAYMPSDVPPLNLTNSPRLQSLVHDGKLYLSLKDAIALALENNLDLAFFRYTLPIAATDLARTKAGGVANGVNVSVSSGTPGGGGSSFGAGTTSGGAGSSNGGAGSAGASGGGAGGLVTSTLGAGTTVHNRDPQLYSQAWLDHTTTQLTNTVTTGTSFFQQNTWEAQAYYSQYFALGTNVQVYYTGLRQATNNLFNATNPTLQSNFQAFVYQPVLAGFGLATNNRYIRIAKKNQQLTDLGFKAQAIATISQVENIYWTLVSAYQDEQVKDRSLQFANQTLEDDKKQLELQAIPAMQVMKDQSAVATAEGDLTVAKANLKLNELYIKNALTKAIDDPQLEDMPVIPLDLSGTPDANENKPIQTLITEAQKNRPDVSMDQIAMERAQISLKTIKNELLPSLTLYGEYAGAGLAGVPNPDCNPNNGCIPETTLPNGFGGALQNTFNYTAPEYQVGFELSITLRNRVAKADQFRSVLEYRQSEIQYEQQKKSITFDVRNSQFALQQSRARVDAALKARDLAQSTFNITKQEQQLGSKSSLDTLAADHDLAVAQSALFTAQAAYEQAKVYIDQATGETLDRMGVSIDDAKAGVVSHMQP
jgi:outer membrane protein TolC